MPIINALTTIGPTAVTEPSTLSGTSLDALFINAGISGSRTLSADTATPGELSQLFMTNAVAPVRLAKRMLPLVDPQAGVITFMSSIMGSV